MGRFYKTDSATPLDYMYSINTPLMEKTLATNDQGITDSLSNADRVGTLANYNHLQGDEADAKAITDNYTRQIEDVSDAIRQDPANWKKQLDPIRNITKALQEDYRSGAISKHVANYNKRKQDFDAIDKQVELYHKTGGVDKSGNTIGINPNAAAKMKAHLDSQFEKTGYDPSTGKYNIYKGGQFMDDINVRKRLSDGFDKLKADGIIRIGEDTTKGGEYFNKVTNKWEGLTQDKLLKLVTERFQGDAGLQNYLKERSSIEEIQGDISNPYNVGKVQRTPEEQAQIKAIQSKINKAKDPAIKAQLQKQLDDNTAELDNRTRVNWNNNSYLAPIFKGIVDQYSYSKTDKENDLSNNSLYNTKLVQAATNQRSALDRNLRKTIADNVNNRAIDRLGLDKDKLTFEKYKWDNPHETGKGTSKTTKVGDKGDPIPETSGVEKLATSSFEDWTTRDLVSGADVPVLSNAGLSSDIDTKKALLAKTTSDISSLDSKIEKETNPNLKKQLELKRQQLQNTVVSTQSELDERRNWYKVSTTKALEKLTPVEQETYNKLEPSRAVDILTKKIEDLRRKYPDKIEKVNNGVGNIVNSKIVAPEVEAAQKQLADYVQVKKKVDIERDNVLTGLRKDYINEDAIQLGKQDGEHVASMLLAAPTGLQLYDNKGEHTSGIALDQKGLAWGTPGKDNKNFSFADGSLSDYIANSGTKMKVLSVAPTTGIGNGNAVARVQFEDPNGEIPKGKDYYVVMTPELQKQIGGKFNNHKIKEVADVGATMADDEDSYLRRQLAKPRIGEDQRFTLKATDNQGNILPLNVTKIDNHLNVTFTNKDGEEIPLPSLSGQKGFFNGNAELIKSFKAIKNGTLK